MRTTASTTTALSSRLRKLAGSLSATAQAAAINDFVARFFSTSSNNNNNNNGSAAASYHASVAAQQSEQQQQQQQRSAAPAAAVNNNDHHLADGENNSSNASSSAAASAPAAEDHAQTPRLPVAADVKEKKTKEPDGRTLVDVLDELVGQQVAGQPDEDVFTILVRNDDSGRRLFQYLVCGEMWYLQLQSADATSLSEQQWRNMRGAQLALDALVRPVPGARKLAITSREDLPVYYMPRWEHGVGASLEQLRRALAEHQERIDTDKPVQSLMLIPPSEEIFAARPDVDVLSVPFEPSGMRMVLPNGHNELSALTLHALSDKRQSTDPIDPAEGEIVANRFRIDQKVGSATFSDAFAVTFTTGDNGEIDESRAQVACIKVIKPEFFDQALDEVRLLSSINELAQARYERAIQMLNEYSEQKQQRQKQQQQQQQAKEDTDDEIPPPEIQEAIRLSYYECGADAFHVVRLTDAFYFRHRMFVVTELLKENLYETTCASLSELENSRASSSAAAGAGHGEYWFDIPRLAIVAKQVTTALELVHSLGLVHADLKPENIMVQSHSRCRVKLIDFGSSAYLHERFSSYVQSRSYRAPEVVLGAPYDSRADVWSLGAVMVELAARGEILFRSTTLANMMARVAAVCGPLPDTLCHAGYHSDCIATRNGVFFSQFSETDDERFEKFEQHPFFYTAQNISGKADGLRVAVESGDADPHAVSDAASSTDFEEKREVWLHFPVYPKMAAASGGGSIELRQDLWRKIRSGGTVADWMDIYEPEGRIEGLLEKHGMWQIGAIVGDERNWSQPVVPELLFLDFVKKCLILDPTLRPTTAQLLTHPFVAAFGANEEDLLLQQMALSQQQPDQEEQHDEQQPQSEEEEEEEVEQHRHE